jgi:N-acetyl-beta-hexosaminidase
MLLAKKIMLAALLLPAIVFSCVANANQGSGKNPKPDTVPAVQEWAGGEGYFTLDKTVQIILGNKEAEAVAQTFAEDVQALTGNKLTVAAQHELQGQKAAKTKKSPYVLFKLEKSAELGEEGYKLDIADNITISAATTKGLFYGTQTLLQMLVQDAGQKSIAKGSIKDAPQVQTRTVMIDLGRKYFAMDYLKKTIRNLAWYKYNSIHLHFTDWNGFRLKSDKFPGLASPDAYSKADIRELQDYAKKYNIMIIPEIDFPAHATHVIRYKPELGFQCRSMNYGDWVKPEMLAKFFPDPELTIYNAGWILDVTKPVTRQFVKELLDEFIPLFDGPYFHIGGDEWQFDDQKEECPELMAYTKKNGLKYPGDVFVEWINEVNQQVKSYGKTTQIWNWWSYNSPTNGKVNKSSISPDKDIVINVWNKIQEEEILASGYKIVSTTETGADALYLTPGLLGQKPGDYGYFDNQFIYEQWTPMVHKNIAGFKLSIWSDGAEDRKDEWYDRHANKPKAVVAERLWGKRDSATLDEFTLRMTAVGEAP